MPRPGSPGRGTRAGSSIATAQHGWQSVRRIEAGGDADTTAAIVGGIVAAHTGIGADGDLCAVPREWLSAREPLPSWVTAPAR
ncbi:hypothetical protein ACFXG4_44025 [Nocardia sp. NPDC059246]|uniref:hypothetical protein n=1 Tax=unclassified Nocardia TaxID=2637762 RepID=UPI0036A7AFDF